MRSRFCFPQSRTCHCPSCREPSNVHVNVYNSRCNINVAVWQTHRSSLRCTVCTAGQGVLQSACLCSWCTWESLAVASFGLHGKGCQV
jgi:hypothetical protein